MILQCGVTSDFFSGSMTFHASPSKIIFLNPSFIAHLMAHQATLASLSREFPLLNCSNHANRRLPTISLPTTATVVFSSWITASKFSLIQLFGGGDQTTSLDGPSFCSFQASLCSMKTLKIYLERLVGLLLEPSTLALFLATHK